MINDLPPQSQPWVREVERSNVETANKLASIKTEAAAQRRATQGVLSSVAARTMDLRARAGTIRNFKGANSATYFGTPSVVANTWVTLGSASVRNLTGLVGNVEYLVVGSVFVSHPSNGSAGRIRILVNGNPSVAMAINGYVGFNYSSVATAGQISGVSRINIEIQAFFANANINQSTVEQYYNCARFNVATVWQ